MTLAAEGWRTQQQRRGRRRTTTTTTLHWNRCSRNMKFFVVIRKEEKARAYTNGRDLADFFMRIREFNTKKKEETIKNDND